MSRVEGFTDAVFAFAVTLLVVALEVPHSFEGLLNVVRGLPAFIICFALLMQFWNAHYKYHRRYGLDDTVSRKSTDPLERTGLRRYSPTGRGPRTTWMVTGPCGVNCTLRSYVAPGNSGTG